MAIKVLLSLFAAFLLANASVASEEDSKFGVTHSSNRCSKSLQTKYSRGNKGNPNYKVTVEIKDGDSNTRSSEQKIDRNNSSSQTTYYWGPSLPLKRVLQSNYLINITSPAPKPAPALDCRWLCRARCYEHPYLERIQCLSACQLCCDRCKCVPPGVSGNKEKCGKCYDEQPVIYGYKITCP